MHRDEVKTFRGNVETHVARLREFDQRKGDEAASLRMACDAADVQPQRTLEYEPSAGKRRRKRFLTAVATAIDDTLGFTLFGIVASFFVGFMSGSSKADGLLIGLLLAAAILLIGVVWTYVLVRRRLSRQRNDP